jgi:hypothetical protein
VLGRTVVLISSSGCLNIGTWCFLLVGARETKEFVLSSKWVLEKTESWCSQQVASCKTEVVASL